MTKQECKTCKRAEFWTDPYYGKVGECEGKPRVRIRPEDECKRVDVELEVDGTGGDNPSLLGS